MSGPRQETGSVPRYGLLATLAGRGEGPEHFAEALRGIALDADDRLVAVGDRAVKVYERDGSLRASWPTEEPPHSVAVDGEGHVIVGEVGLVEVFDAAGTREAVLRDPERLGRVTAVAPLADGLLLADADARRLRRYDAQGRHVADLGHEGRMKGFLIPNGVLDFAVDDRGIVHAANPGKHRIERYTLDGELLGHIGRFDGRDPAGFRGCCNPTNVTVVGHDRVYVTEKAGPRAKVYDGAGKLLAVIAEEAFDPACKNMDLAVDSAGRVHVVDTASLEVLVFGPLEEGGGDGR